ncbi:MAG: DUF5615 family PIN-like protein [Armatimonadetes bacterium]|nr:DUF5615 family PIN-like protein [Armatimonadota bacterium]
MTFLFDENLPASLCRLLEDLYPGSVHAAQVGLGGATDRDVQQYAIDNGHVVATKDSDHAELALTLFQGAKVVWIRLGNCNVSGLHLLLRNSLASLEALSESDEVVLVIP